MTARLHDDPGLQPERTSLAWNRTVVALLVAATTMLRWAHEYPVVIVVLAVVLIGLALVIVATSASRYRDQAASFGRERAEAKTLSVLLLTACMVIFGAGELVMMLRAVG